MDKRTSDALEASIKHWEDNVKAKTAETVLLGTQNCALCGLFRDMGCSGCPVAVAAKSLTCIGTPYDDVVDCKSKWQHNIGTKAAGLKLRTAFRKAARAELSFLKSLREDGA